ncbi:MAG: hypothetical protein LCH52_00300 [Bacteroidetes bacterium]|nr:hypothetical protein [Bacteroidota bacterium]
MRTKTIVLFFLVLTGMIFPQQGKSDRISLNKILKLLALPAPEVVSLALEKEGYLNMGAGKYKKGIERFEIFRKSEFDPLYYFEEVPGKKRLEQFKAEALNEGFKIVNETESSWAMEGFKYSIRAHPRMGIRIDKMK